MPVGSVSPFRPIGTKAIAASAASSNAALAPGGDTVVVTNTSSSLAFVRFGADATVVASTSDMPVLSNDKVIFLSTASFPMQRRLSRLVRELFCLAAAMDQLCESSVRCRES